LDFLGVGLGFSIIGQEFTIIIHSNKPKPQKQYGLSLTKDTREEKQKILEKLYFKLFNLLLLKLRGLIYYF
jgi:hypothetical protein